eukprot:CAMPEP_0206479072 /NCGR_PEP_ID=MMETSP0324_2-20121206/36462_1 /ASSEMBLY_ACC=CAM_ASM_000836 /TAXON_ID=2866 /ORGANISM="Crypthecodinium cohnii, Strain Seligo" /LENGTH=437 /DNA_ID=CAMNT_0053955561 /DNA_START=34 /DNA_END=1344 /DNA_ORIENTATION=-
MTRYGWQDELFGNENFEGFLTLPNLATIFKDVGPSNGKHCNKTKGFRSNHQKPEELTEFAEDPGQLALPGQSLQSPNEADSASGPEAAPGNSLDGLVTKCAIFQECSYDFIEEVTMQLKRVLYKPGQVIAQESLDTPASMFFVHWGGVSMSRAGQVCGTIPEGRSFGEAAVLGIVPEWQYTFQTTSSCMVSELHMADLQNIIARHSEEGEYFQSLIEQLENVEGFGDFSPDRWKTLRRSASLRQCSRDFLQELDGASAQHVFFPTEILAREGQQDDRLFIVDQGVVGVEISGRLVRQEEVPSLHTRLSYGEDYRLLRESVDRKNRGSSSAATSGRSSHQQRRGGNDDGQSAPSSESASNSDDQSDDDGDDDEDGSEVRVPSSRMTEERSSVIYRAISFSQSRLQAANANDSADSDEDSSNWEAAIFGEETFLGLLPA